MTYEKDIPWCSHDNTVCEPMFRLREIDHDTACRLSCSSLVYVKASCETCIKNVLMSDAEQRFAGLKNKYATCKVHGEFCGPCNFYKPLPNGEIRPLNRHE